MCLERGLTCKYREPKDKDARKFLQSIRFNELFGLKEERYNDFLGTAPFLQLQWMTTKNTYMAERIVQVFGEGLNMTEGVRESLVMSLNELMNNAFDHSESQIGCLVCAQAYPAKRTIRACLMDFGMGIRKSLSRNVKWQKKIKNDVDAIRLAIREGVSSIEGSRGLGLARLEDFLKINEGEMIIVSGNGYLKKEYKKEGEEGRIRKHEMKGTGISIVIRTHKSGLYALKEEVDYLF